MLGFISTFRSGANKTRTTKEVYISQSLYRLARNISRIDTVTFSQVGKVYVWFTLTSDASRIFKEVHAPASWRFQPLGRLTRPHLNTMNIILIVSSVWV